MNRARLPSAARRAPSRGLTELRARLAVAEQTLHAIRHGEVDAVVVAGKQGPQVFTLEGAEHAYRVLIESMNEGALTLTAKGVMLYTNRCFASMVKCPQEQVVGSSFRRFLSAADLTALRPLLQQPGKSGSKVQVLLSAADGSQLPVQLSLRPLAKNGSSRATVGIVVTDMTEARHNELRLRALSRRLVEAQEVERRQVAVELHENISQLTYGILMRCESLARKMPAQAHSSRAELLKLRDLLDRATEEVRRISQDLRPSALDDLGLQAVLRMACDRFAQRTRVQVNLEGVSSIARLPVAVETALYRILQEVLRNVERHARARHVAVRLRRQGDVVRLAITDDGIGFDPDRYRAEQKAKGGLGLLGMRERAISVGGALSVQSAPGHGTTVRAQIPLGRGTQRPSRS
jgi:PAS domain S-box-containing protein